MEQVISTDRTPALIGPYTQTALTGNALYVLGQIPVNPVTGEVVTGIEAATKQVMENLKVILVQVGTIFKKVVKTTIFLAGMGQFVQVNGVYACYFNERTAPTRETVQVTKLPRGAEAEISRMAVL